MKVNIIVSTFITFSILAGCRQTTESTTGAVDDLADSLQDVRVKPRFTTSRVQFDSDDPAFWIHPTDPMQSLIIGTDKDTNGGLFIWNVKGEPLDTIKGLLRPNNVDVVYGIKAGNRVIDAIIVSERERKMMRIFSLPDLLPADNGGIPLFEGESLPDHSDPMGIAGYRSPEGEVYAIAGRKSGPTDGTYLWQYKLTGNEAGNVTATLVRRFGNFSGKKEIEAIAVDHKLGYIYYSDEQHGVRKYHARPDQGNEELAMFATSGFLDDHEGISIYELSDTTGYIIVSDQRRNAFRVYPREGTPGNPHDHPELAVIYTHTNNSDGSEITWLDFGGLYPGGLFAAMSDDGTFQLYSWKDMAGDKLQVRE